jgi:hypothetical protein
MKIPVWLLTSDDDSSGRQVEAYGREKAANLAAAALVEIMVEQNRETMPQDTEVTTENWCEVHAKLMERAGFDDYLWLDQVEVDVELGPIAVTIEGGAVQDVVTDDKRLLGLDALIIDYDINGAELTYNVTQKNHKGEVDGVSEAVVTDAAVSLASGINLAELWHNFQNDEDGLDDEEAA